MAVDRGQDECSECGMPLPNEDPRPDGADRTPCPRCGSKKRIKHGEVHMTATASVNADAKLIISWHEVDRLLSEKEYAAALLVAAVNVEFILWENLRRFAPSAVSKADNNIKSVWGQVRANKPETVSLGSLLKVTEFFSKHDKLRLSPAWDPIASVINEVRRRIAHERGYFAKLTQLNDADWAETRIRQVLQDAKEFCHGNAP